MNLVFHTAPLRAAKTTLRCHRGRSRSLHLCDRCIRGSTIFETTGYWPAVARIQAGIAFDNNLPMSESSCVSCGECMVSCPTGALTNKRVVGPNSAKAMCSILPNCCICRFSRTSRGRPGLNQKAVVKRHFKAGELSAAKRVWIDAFYILEGKAEVFLASPDRTRQNGRQQKDFLVSCKSVGTSRGRPPQ